MRPIDADALLHKLVNTDPNTKGKFGDGIAKALCFIINAPAIEAEPVRHGRWDRGQCTNCKVINPAYNKDWSGDYIFKETPYCPNCGAKMDKEG